MSWLWRMSGWLSFNETLGETNLQSRAINIASWLFERCLMHICLQYMLWYFPIARKMSLPKSGQKQGESMRFELQGRETDCRPDVIVQFCRTFFMQLQWELAIFALVNLKKNFERLIEFPADDFPLLFAFNFFNP